MDGKLILLIIFMAIFSVAIRHGMKQSHQESSIANQAGQELAAVQEDAHKNYPNEPEIIAMKKASTNKIKEMIAAQESKEKQLQLAANAFFGFYLANYKTRKDYCQAQGVDITPFTDAFKELHNDVYVKAVKAKAASVTVEKVYRELKPKFLQIIEKDMQFIADEYGISISEACQAMSDNAQDAADMLHMYTSQPEVYNFLMRQK